MREKDDRPSAIGATSAASSKGPCKAVSWGPWTAPRLLKSRRLICRAPVAVVVLAAVAVIVRAKVKAKAASAAVAVAGEAAVAISRSVRKVRDKASRNVKAGVAGHRGHRAIPRRVRAMPTHLPYSKRTGSRWAARRRAKAR